MVGGLSIHSCPVCAACLAVQTALNNSENNMHRFSYWVCFTLVALACVRTTGGWSLSAFGIHPPFMTSLYSFSLFGSLVPPMLASSIPQFIAVGLNLIMLALVFRRVWFSIAKRQGVPHSFVGFSKTLGYIGAWSFTLTLALSLLLIFFRAGSGVPAGLLALPAMFCVPWAFFLTEIGTLHKAQGAAG